jgi:hypothetical protein
VPGTPFLLAAQHNPAEDVGVVIPHYVKHHAPIHTPLLQHICSVASAGASREAKARLIKCAHAAPRQYAGKLCALLIEAGARPIWLPTIQISSLPEGAGLSKLDEALELLPSFTHLAFTSKNGIAAVLKRLTLRHGNNAQQFLQDSGIKVRSSNLPVSDMQSCWASAP